MGAKLQAKDDGARLGTSRRLRSIPATMRAALPRWLSAALLALIVMTVPIGVGVASADPAPGTPSAPSGGKLPGDFPADLRKYVGGTDEFKAAEWFNGACKDKGGDIGAYINATFPVEGRLLYWSQSEEDRKTNGADKKEVPSFPAGDSQFFMPTGMCAQDMVQWGTKAWTVWGFDFAPTPDKESLALIFGSIDPDLKGLPPADQAKLIEAKSRTSGGMYLYNKLFEQFSTEKTKGIYRGHAFFLNCEAGNNAARKAQCQTWNTKVGNLILGTYNWIEKNKSFGDRVDEAFNRASNNWKESPYVQTWNVVYNATSAVVKFVQDPTSAADGWANDMKDWAMDLTPEILRGLATVGRFDFNEPGFVKWYILSITVGWLVLVLMLLVTVVQGNNEKMPMSDVMKSFFAYTPGTLFAMAALPLILATFIVPFANALTDNLSTMLGSSVQDTIASVNEMFQGLNQKTLVGGTISGVIGFGALGLGSIGMYLGFVMHYLAVPLGTMAAGMALGMYVNPQMRPKALRPLLALLAVILSKPLLFLLLGVVFWLLNLTSKGSVTGDGRVQSFGALVFVALVFLTLGAAPFAVLKWAPVLPSPEDAPGFTSQGGTVVGAAMGSAASSMAMRRAYTPVSSGGGGRGGGSSSGTPGAPAPAASSARGQGGPGATQAQGAATTPTVGAQNSSAGGKGAGASGRVGSHASSFLSAAKGTTRAVGGHLGVAAVAAGSAVGAGAKKARDDVNSSGARGEM